LASVVSKELGAVWLRCEPKRLGLFEESAYLYYKQKADAAVLHRLFAF